MTYAKLIDGAIQYAPKPLTVDGLVHYHPSDELYLSVGYLPVVDTPCPDDPEIYYVSHWEEQDGKIVKVWTETAPPEQPDPAPVYSTAEELLDILLGVKA